MRHPQGARCHEECQVDWATTSRCGRFLRLQGVALQPFDQVVTDFGAVVLRVCRAVLGPVDAEDAWSETFLAALQAYPQLPPGTNLEAWLVTVAHRKAVDVVRGRTRRAVLVEAPPEPGDRAEVGAECGPELYEALQRLPDKQRHAVAYHYLGGLPHAEVAQILGGSTEAARRAAADGIDKLRRAMRASPVAHTRQSEEGARR
jgi:RNA polymerase sigma factor (sigma-70 family)